MASMCDQTYGIERSADHVIRIPLLEDSDIACVDVEPGDKIVLPFDISSSDISDDMAVRVRLLDSTLIIEQDEGATIFLEGFARAYDVREVVVLGIHGTPIDAALWVAVTDPGIIISH
jgi:hypothetical protein